MRDCKPSPQSNRRLPTTTPEHLFDSYKRAAPPSPIFLNFGHQFPRSNSSDFPQKTALRRAPNLVGYSRFLKGRKNPPFKPLPNSHRLLHVQCPYQPLRISSVQKTYQYTYPKSDLRLRCTNRLVLLCHHNGTLRQSQNPY